MEGFWEVEMSCFVCKQAYSSPKSMLEHMKLHVVVFEQGRANSKPSTTTTTQTLRAGLDLLSWPIKTRKRSSLNREALVVFNPPPPPLVQPKNRFAVANFRPQKVVDLPLKKRFLHVVRGREHIQFICSACAKSFASAHSLGAHKAHHKRAENKRRASIMEGEDVAGDKNAPPQQKRQRRPWSGGAYPCMRCDREFSSPQGLGVHRHHCKGPPPAAEINTKMIRCFNLNELPTLEEDEKMLALACYDL